MTISVNQQVDFLWKKLGFGLTKTDVPSMKDATNESIVSAPFLPGDRIWAESELIPTVLPGADTSVIEVFNGANSALCTMDLTSTINRTWLTNLTDWIPIEYGSTYQAKVFLAPTASVAPQVDGIQLYAAGTGNNDEWFFDYESGVLHFIGDNLPSVDFSGKSIFINGGRYVGVKGLGSLTSGTFGDFTISGNSIVSSGNVILSASNSGNIYVSGNTIGNVGYPTLPTDAATVQYVTDSISMLQPNSIWQGDSSVSIADTGASSQLTVTINGEIVSTFSNAAITLANLTITTATLSSDSDLTLTPAAGNVVAINSSTALAVPVGLTTDRPAAPLAGYVRFNTTSSVLECFNGTDWVSAQTSIDNQVLLGNGVQTVFTLIKPALATDLIVATNGVIQLPNVAYTVSGTSITFAEVPLSSDIIEIRFISQSVSPTASAGSAVVVDGAVVMADITPVNMDTFSFGAYRSAKYTVSITYSDGNSQMSDVMVTHNGYSGILTSVDTQILVSSTPVTGGTNSMTFTSYAWAGLCVVQVTSSTALAKVKFHKTYFTV